MKTRILPVRCCPKCKREIKYSHWSSFYLARKINCLCKSCSAKNNMVKRDISGVRNPFWGRTHTRETIEKIINHPVRKTEDYHHHMSRDMSGMKNPMYGKTMYDVWVQKYGKEEADRRRKEKANKTSRQCSGTGNPMYGKPAPKGAGHGWKGWYKGWFFRSLKELSYMINVIEKKGHRWQSAETHDWSIHFLDWAGHERTYRADFFLDGKKLVEVKPKNLMNTPTNLAKRRAAEIFCADRGYKYAVEESEPLSDEEIARLWKEKTIVFQDRYDKMFRERYAI